MTILAKVVLVGAAIVLMVGTGWYVGGQGMFNGESTGGEKISGTGTIIDLLKLGRAISCTYTQESEKAGKGYGSVYLDGLTRIQVDGRTTKGTEEFDSHIIYDSANMYVWIQSPQRSFAVVVPVKNQITTTKESSATLDTQTVYDDVTYECTSWDIDESVFAQPKNVTFTDVAGMLQEVFK